MSNKYQSPLWLQGRSAGVLFHPSSLPGTYGIGSLGSHAYQFVDFLEKAGFSFSSALCGEKEREFISFSCAT